MRRLRVVVSLIVASLGGAAAAASGGSAAPAELTGVKVEQHGGSLAVLVKTGVTPRYAVELLSAPTRVVIDMEGAYASPRVRWSGTPEPIQEIRGSQYKPGTARIVLELQRPVPHRIEEVPDGLRVVLDAAASDKAGTAAGPQAAAKPAAAAYARLDGKPAPVPPPPALAPRREEPKAQTAAPPVSEPKPVAGALPAPAGGPKSPMTAAPPAGPPVATAKPAVAPAPPMAAASKPAAPPAPVVASSAIGAPAAAPKARPKADLVAAAPLAPLGATSTPQAAVAIVPVTPAPVSVQIAQAQTAPRAPAPAPPAGPKLISLDFKDADVINLLRILSAESGRNIVAGDDVKGKASVSLRNVTWEEALDTILEVKGLQKIEKGGVIRIVSSEQLAKEREAAARAEDAKRKAEIDTRTKLAEAQLKEAELANRRAQAEAAAEEARLRGPLREEVVRLLYADPEEVAKTLQGILGIPAEGTAAVSSALPVGPGLIAEPPFSALYNVPSRGEVRDALQPRPAIPINADVLAKGLTIRAHKPTNTIFLRLHAADLERTKKLIREQLDVPLPQVKIEARMEILDRRALEAFGIQWGGAVAGTSGNTALVASGFPNNPTTVSGIGVTPVPGNPNLNLGGLLPISPLTGLPVINPLTNLPTAGSLVNLPFSALPNAATVIPAAGLAFGIIGTDFNINIALEALAEDGKTRTLARPEIVTVENNKASVSLGEEIPYATVSSAGTQIQFKEAVLKLDVTPTVIRERTDGRDLTRIKMLVLVENNSRGDAVNLGTGGTPPAINKRKAETLVTIQEGERLVIGGVTNTVSQNTIRKVPILGDIPYLGWAFKQREFFEQGRELVVFVTPTVLRGPGQAAAPRPSLSSR